MHAEAMRVLMTADAVGGVWTYALDLARRLADHRVAVTLATMGPPPGADQVVAARAIPRLDLIVSRFKLEWMDDPWDDVAKAGVWLLDLESRIRPDVVHLNGYAHAALPFRAPALVVGHSCLLSWAEAIPGAIDPGKLDAYRRRVGPALGAASHVAAPSHTMLSALQRHYGPLPRTSVIANGRRHGAFPPGRKEPFVMTAGRLWDRAKNVELVGRVAAALPWPVAMAGDGGLSLPHVRALGRLSDAGMADWLGRAAIFALPARYEPFGLLPLEAALTGCALVLGDIPSLREVWGDAAQYADPEDAGALLETLTALIAAPSRLREHAAAARERALGYGAARMGDAYVQLYASLRREASSSRSMACAS